MNEQNTDNREIDGEDTENGLDLKENLPPSVSATEHVEHVRGQRKIVQRTFPAAPFEEALELPIAIQVHASGQRIRRLRLFELMQRSPESGRSRQLITNSGRYGLTTGGYKAEWIELTADGKIATADDVPVREKIRVHFKLSIADIPPFNKLYKQFINNRVPAKSVMMDFLRSEGVSDGEVSECVDTFLLNAKFVGIVQSISGAERILPLEHVLDYAPSGIQSASNVSPSTSAALATTASLKTEASIVAISASGTEDEWNRMCFYITPIGADGSEPRLHADLFLGSIIEPALEEFGLNVVRADRISSAGMITRQVIEHIVRSRLVIADLSFHNPNVFYELALRHATGLPTVQVMRASDPLPFDVNQVRTIRIDTSSIYALVPQLNMYRAAITSQVRRALEDPESVDNPVTTFNASFKVRQQISPSNGSGSGNTSR